MKEFILVLALQFSQDFNQPIDNIQYRIGDLDHVLVIHKTQKGYEIVIDKSLSEIANAQQLKTIVYHATGKAVGMEVSDDRTFMNPKYIFKRYNTLSK